MLERMLLSAALSALAETRSINCTLPGNGTFADGEAAFGNSTFSEVSSGNGTVHGNGTCEETRMRSTDFGMVKVGVLTAVLVVVMISTCRLLFKMYAQFGMRDNPDGVDKGFGE